MILCVLYLAVSNVLKLSISKFIILSVAVQRIG